MHAPRHTRSGAANAEGLAAAMVLNSSRSAGRLCLRSSKVTARASSIDSAIVASCTTSLRASMRARPRSSASARSPNSLHNEPETVRGAEAPGRARVLDDAEPPFGREDDSISR